MVAMRPLQFDPFGEPVAQGVEQATSSSASRIALRSGVGLFWMMVVAIVAARAVYFDPDLTEKFGNLASLLGHLSTIVGT